jgi:hypothetical protein
MVWVPAHVADTRPHDCFGPEVLLLGHNIYLNDVKDRAAVGVTRRNGAIQAGVNRQPDRDIDCSSKNPR